MLFFELTLNRYHETSDHLAQIFLDSQHSAKPTLSGFPIDCLTMAYSALVEAFTLCDVSTARTSHHPDARHLLYWEAVSKMQ